MLKEIQMKSMRKAKKIIAFAAAFIFIANGCGKPDTARAISVVKTNGENAVTVNQSGREQAARVGASLSEGYSASTGAVSNIFLDLDDKSVIKMDELTWVDVKEVSARKLSVELVTGALFADITRRSDDDDYEFRTGNHAMVVRGTKFVIEMGRDEIIFVMLSGSAYIDGKTLAAGEAAEVNISTGDIVIAPIGFERLSAFALGEIVELGSELVASFTFKESDIENAEII